MDIRFYLLLVCFFVSGFAGLVYETAWTREFAFVFGTSELAVSAVLAAYMAGLAFGAAVAARLAPRLRRPVLAYGLIELAIGLAALAVPFGIRFTTGFYLQWLGGLEAPPETVGLATALFHLLATFVVLIPCTALMGATLPLLARYAVRQDDQIGPRIGVLYATNTAGAIAGALTSAFWLLPEFGLRDTVYFGVFANFVVFVAAAGLARRATPAEETGAVTAGVAHWILPAIAISGAISFVYEVVWVRLLGFVLGGSTAAFATMLASFLMGIALGSAGAARWARSRRHAATGFVGAQLGTAFFAWLVFRFADDLPGLASMFRASPTDLLGGSAVAILLLLPITVCIGATFPFAVRLHAPHADAAAAASARVYAWNTVGSIVGSIAAGFFLLPGIGFHGSVMLGVGVNISLALWALFVQPVARRPFLLAVGALAVLVWVSPPVPPTGLFLQSSLAQKRVEGQLVFAGVGRSATVVLRTDGFGWKLMTNGLPESTIEKPINPPDAFHPAQWLSLLPVLNRPDTKSLLVIGLGGGNTAGAITPGLERVDVIELEPEVVHANRLLANSRMYGDPLADPRVSLHYGDARGALMLTDRLYDGIVSQPSHPWTSGASHLYTREFFELVKQRLTPDGVFVQWIGLAFVDEELVRSLLNTLNEVFPYVETYRPFEPALLFVASKTPLDLTETVEEAIASAPEQFARVGVLRPEHVAVALAIDSEGTKRAGKGAPLNTDDHNLLATSAWRIGDPALNRKEVVAMLAAYDSLSDQKEAWEPVAVAQRLAKIGHNARAARVLSSLDGSRRQTAAGWVAYEQGANQRAKRIFARAHAADPDDPEARAGWILTAPEEVEVADVTPLEWSFRQAWIQKRAGEAADLIAFEPELSTLGPDQILYEEAIRMRADWRVASADPERAEEALILIDQLIARGARAEDYVARAEASAAAGAPDQAWATLSRARPHLKRAKKDRPLVERATALARSLPDRPGTAHIIVFYEAL